jgi:hypothetical protein
MTLRSFTSINFERKKRMGVYDEWRGIVDFIDSYVGSWLLLSNRSIGKARPLCQTYTQNKNMFGDIVMKKLVTYYEELNKFTD